MDKQVELCCYCCEKLPHYFYPWRERGLFEIAILCENRMQGNMEEAQMDKTKFLSSLLGNFIISVRATLQYNSEVWAKMRFCKGQ